MLAAGGTKPATASAGGDDEAWDVRALAALDIPILQGLCLTWDRASWAASDEGMTPARRGHPGGGAGVRRPDHHGAVLVQGDRRRRAAALRPRPRALPAGRRDRGQPRPAAAHPAGAAPDRDRAVGLPDQALPDRQRRRAGHAGLVDQTAPGDARRRATTSASRARSRAPAHCPVEGEAPDTTAGNALIHALIDAGGQDPEWLTAEQLAGQPVRIAAGDLPALAGRLPDDLVDAVTAAWGEAPGELFVDRTRDPDGEIVAATLQAGNVVILVQPPRGFGENPIAIYHDPDLAPSPPLPGGLPLDRAGVRRARDRPRRQARQPGVAARQDPRACRPSCGTDAAIGSLPLIYPFLVNDPGEGTQAKRRAHATIVDHLVPPMARAESLRRHRPAGAAAGRVRQRAR